MASVRRPVPIPSVPLMPGPHGLGPFPFLYEPGTQLVACNVSEHIAQIGSKELVQLCLDYANELLMNSLRRATHMRMATRLGCDARGLHWNIYACSPEAFKVLFRL